MTSHARNLIRRLVSRDVLLEVFDRYVKGATSCIRVEVKCRWCQWQLGMQCSDKGSEQSCGLVLSGVDPFDSRLNAVNLYSGDKLMSLKALLYLHQQWRYMCQVNDELGGVVATYDVLAPRLAVKFKRSTFKSPRKVLAL